MGCFSGVCSDKILKMFFEQSFYFFHQPCQWRCHSIPWVLIYQSRRKALTSRLETYLSKLNILEPIGFTSEYKTVESSNLLSTDEYAFTDGSSKIWGQLMSYPTLFSRNSFFSFNFKYVWCGYLRLNSIKGMGTALKVYSSPL